jgi:hypothetical protein
LPGRLSQSDRFIPVCIPNTISRIRILISNDDLPNVAGQSLLAIVCARLRPRGPHMTLQRQIDHHHQASVQQLAVRMHT